MPLINPVVIGGKVVGAYVDETYAIDGQGKATLTELLQYILTIVNGGGFTPLANNGLNVDGGFIQLGGTLIETTTITNTNQLLKIGQDIANNKAYILQDNTGKTFIIHHEDATFLNFIAASSTGFGVQLENKSTGIGTKIDLSAIQGEFTVSDGNTGNFLSGIIIEQTQMLAFGVRTYANTAAAQADSTFQVGGIYRLNGDSVLRIKTT